MMKKVNKRLICAVLALILIIPSLASCSNLTGDNEESSVIDSGSETEAYGSESTATDSETDADIETETDEPSGSDDETEVSETVTETVAETENETESSYVDQEEETLTPADGSFGSTIAYSNAFSNKVQGHYLDSVRDSFRILNTNMSLDYNLENDNGPMLLNALCNSQGKPYLTNTMDAFVRMEGDEEYFYASGSTADARMNIYKLGYHYYDFHFMGQDFRSDLATTSSLPISLESFKNNANEATLKYRGDEILYKVNGGDPFIYSGTTDAHTNKINFSTEDYNAIEITIKTTTATSCLLYYAAGSHTTYNNEQNILFSINPDGEYHTYTVILSEGKDYTGDLYGIRLDINGSKDEYTYIKEIKAVKIESSVPSIVLDRVFHTYAEKMHQVLHFVSKVDTTGIAELGMRTEIAADTVDKLVIKDKDGLKYSLDGVDFDSVEYVGFDIKDTGIFGYILPVHENSGKLNVTLEDGVYVIVQSSTPENGTILAPAGSTANDYYMGQRIYTDERHTFDKFIAEAEFERAPEIGITTSTENLGYDPLSGAFVISIEGATNFNPPYFYEWNRHYSTDINLKNRSASRTVYLRTHTNYTFLEAAAMLDENGMMIPVPLEVAKNFKGENEEPIFDNGDAGYSEVIFPIVLEENSQYSFTILNMYQNWGKVPLKQLSSIQFWGPYYHLSAGVTETSCIAPWFTHPEKKDLWTLPDFRSMSAPMWASQPQHTHGGYHYFLEFTDSDGNYNASEIVSNDIDSSGPTYADVAMSYYSDDGRIKVTYSHIEFPQTDEMRAFYEIEYEILEDIEFSSFKRDFAFYTTTGWGGKYANLSYLDETNKPVTTTSCPDAEPKYFVLGDECPYAAFWKLVGGDDNNYVNTGIAIHSSDIIIGGEKFDGNFVIKGASDRYSLTLDLDETTLKAGDSIKLNMIVIPWGSQLTTDDSNMQNVREDSCLEPLRAEVIDGELIDSVFVPRIRSTNKTSATFTLTGGADKCAVRVYGFDNLTVPKISELVDGNWVEYEICSINSPDLVGYKHYYDGYTVYYDEDGTYSYAFVVDMTDDDGNNLSRTFKVDTSEAFTEWPEIPEDDGNSLIVYLSPVDFFARTNNGLISGVGSAEILSEDGLMYLSLTGDGKGVFESQTMIFTQSKSDDMISTGRYLVIKYRSYLKSNYFDFFIGDKTASPTGKGDSISINTVNDGEWHVAVLDLSTLSAYTETDGEYFARYLRFDVFNGTGGKGTDETLHLAYIGISDSLTDIIELNSDAETLIFKKNNITGYIDVATGEICGFPIEPDLPDYYVDPSSGYTESTVPFGCGIDFVNGYGRGGAEEAFASVGGGTLAGPAAIIHDGTTIPDTYVVSFAGWNVVLGGVEKYMWSADGGVTWNDAPLYKLPDFVAGGTAVLAAAASRSGATTAELEPYVSKSVFPAAVGNTRGISADLSEYKGQTVNVTFAAVPKDDPDSLCVMLYLLDVKVPE